MGLQWDINTLLFCVWQAYLNLVFFVRPSEGWNAAGTNVQLQGQLHSVPRQQPFMSNLNLEFSITSSETFSMRAHFSEMPLRFSFFFKTLRRCAGRRDGSHGSWASRSQYSACKAELDVLSNADTRLLRWSRLRILLQLAAQDRLYLMGLLSDFHLRLLQKTCFK